MTPGTARSTHPQRYKWIALSNTTIGILMATINSSIVLIALPDIFRGINLNPLTPSNSSYLLWMIMGFLVATAVLVVSFGRVGDIYGRVRMFTLGFAIFTIFSLLLAVTWTTGPEAAVWMIVMRIGQGVGGAFLFANSAAILTDAFPHDQRGMALGVNAVAGIAGSFIGLVLGGILGPIDWRLVFLVSVPVGLFGTVWSYFKLRGARHPPAGEDRLVGQPHVRRRADSDSGRDHVRHPALRRPHHGLDEPARGRGDGAGWPADHLRPGRAARRGRDVPPVLFRIRAFTFGNIADAAGIAGRGGLQFMLIIWLQGIWLPLHGYGFSQTPLWAGYLHAAVDRRVPGCRPASGFLSDRFGARPFATGGMLIAALAFFLLERLPVTSTTRVCRFCCCSSASAWACSPRPTRPAS